jgi:hypothetical protein
MKPQEAAVRRELLSSLARSVEDLLIHLPLNSEHVSRMEAELRESTTLIEEDFSQELPTSSLRVVSHLSPHALLCRRICLGSGADAALDAARAAILQFFIYAQFPVDLDSPECIDDSFVTDPKGYLERLGGPE